MPACFLRACLQAGQFSHMLARRRSFSVICFIGVIIRDIWLDGKKEIDIVTLFVRAVEWLNTI